MNKVSVIIPCLNVEGYLEKAVDSCIRQTQLPFEIIIVDNGSTDHTLKVARKLEIAHKGLIKVLECAKPGAPAARNMGWHAAQSAFIQFLDADDLLLPDKLERQGKLIQDDTSMVIGTAIYKQLDDTEVTIAPDEDVWKGTFKGEHAGNTCANLWPKKVLEQVGGWDESLANTQDYDLIFRVLKINDLVSFSMDPDSIHQDRVEGQISKQDPAGNALRALNLRVQMTDWLGAYRPDYYQKNKIYYDQLLHTFIINVAKHDLQKAKTVFLKYLGKDFVPKLGNQFYTTKREVLLTKLLGFELTQKVKNAFRKLRG